MNCVNQLSSQEIYWSRDHHFSKGQTFVFATKQSSDHPGHNDKRNQFISSINAIYNKLYDPITTQSIECTEIIIVKQALPLGNVI